MNWLLPVYLVVLAFVSVRRPVGANSTGLRRAWVWLAALAISHFFFALIRAGNFRDPRAIALTEIWADGIQWLFLGISFLSAGSGLLPIRADQGVASAGSGAQPQPPPL
jgi:hypothetical protein